MAACGKDCSQKTEPFDFADEKRIEAYAATIQELITQHILPPHTEWKNVLKKVKFYVIDSPEGHRSVVFSPNDKDFVTVEIRLDGIMVVPTSERVKENNVYKLQFVGEAESSIRQIFQNSCNTLCAMKGYNIYPKNCRYFCYSFLEQYGILHDPTGEGFVQNVLDNPTFNATVSLLFLLFLAYLKGKRVREEKMKILRELEHNN